jgi:hypothetical protein
MDRLLDFLSDIAWPLLGAAIFISLYKEIKAAFPRIRELGLSGVKLGDAPTEQVPARATAETTGLIQTAGATPGAAVKDVIQNIKEVVPPDQLDPAVKEIKSKFQQQFPNKDDQLELMTYGIASLNIQLTHERNYRNIYGSQANALISMNAAGGASEDTLKQIYAQAAVQWPDLYKHVSFNGWGGFLVASGLAVQVENSYQTTPYGRGFLKYAVDQHLFFPKPF